MAAVLVDFDGTITMKDTSELVLRRFAEGDWEELDRQMDRGVISLERCMIEQFKHVRTRPGEILKFLDGVVVCRPGFPEFVNKMREHGHKVKIVSAGLDFVIEHFLTTMRVARDIEVVCGRTSLSDHIDFEFPTIQAPDAKDFKQDAVLHHLKTGEKVVYVGDGSSDYNAARSSSFCFTVRGSRLEKLCSSEGVRFMPFEKFDEIEGHIDNINKY